MHYLVHIAQRILGRLYSEAIYEGWIVQEDETKIEPTIEPTGLIGLASMAVFGALMSAGIMEIAHRKYTPTTLMSIVIIIISHYGAMHGLTHGNAIWKMFTCLVGLMIPPVLVHKCLR